MMRAYDDARSSDGGGVGVGMDALMVGKAASERMDVVAVNLADHHEGA